MYNAVSKVEIEVIKVKRHGFVSIIGFRKILDLRIPLLQRRGREVFESRRGMGRKSENIKRQKAFWSHEPSMVRSRQYIGNSLGSNEGFLVPGQRDRMICCYQAFSGQFFMQRV